MAVSLPDDLTSAISAAVSDPSSSNLFALGNSVLKKFNESDGKLLFLVLANPDQWNSALTSASSEPTFIGVYASTSMYLSFRAIQLGYSLPLKTTQARFEYFPNLIEFVTNLASDWSNSTKGVWP